MSQVHKSSFILTLLLSSQNASIQPLSHLSRPIVSADDPAWVFSLYGTGSEVSWRNSRNVIFADLVMEQEVPCSGIRYGGSLQSTITILILFVMMIVINEWGRGYERVSKTTAELIALSEFMAEHL